MKLLTTEQMVRRCFCYDCDFMQENLNTGAKLPCKTLCPTCLANSVYLARAARRFVKMEQKHKRIKGNLRFLKECRKKAVNQGVNKLPKHWGELK